VSVVLNIFGSPVLPAAIPCRRSRYRDDERGRPHSTDTPEEILSFRSVIPQLQKNIALSQ